MKLRLPRGYLSWTQFILWKSSQETYRKRYHVKGDSFQNDEMRYGKRVAEHLEKDTEEDDEIIKALGSLLPRYPKMGYEMRAVLKSKGCEIHLLSFFDTYKPRNHAFREDKTGRVPWTQKKAEKHKQLFFYALVIYLKTGKIPKEVHLDWIETKTKDGVVSATGKIVSFKVEISLADVLTMAGQVTKVAREISEDYKEAFNKTL